ncbi:YvrJ family protein [Synergistaceae bacterium OttesenSCG-928-I11]|nr:YvrJ family protein [Synergistaceae bacterium OttesenSCG-928-I11]
MQSTFSIAVAGYLLVRMEARLDGLTEAITRLRAAIERKCPPADALWTDEA